MLKNFYFTKGNFEYKKSTSFTRRAFFIQCCILLLSNEFSHYFVVAFRDFYKIHTFC